MSELRNETPTTSGNTEKGIPKIIMFLCYMLVIVFAVFGIYLGLRTYGRVNMKTALAYAIDSRYNKQNTLVTALTYYYNVHKIDNVYITVVNINEDQVDMVESLADGLHRLITIAVPYKQYARNFNGTTNSYTSVIVGYIWEFNDDESASVFYELQKVREIAADYEHELIRAYYFYMPVLGDIPSTTNDMELLTLNRKEKGDAISKLWYFSNGIGPTIYNKLG